MNKSDMLHNTLIATAILIMIGVLAFFYDKTQAVDLREQNEVLGLLNELKDIDNRWDFEAQRARIDLGKSELATLSRADAGDKALRDITRVAEHTTSSALRSGLTELRKTIALKAELFERFKAENRLNKDALLAILSNANELTSQAVAKPGASISLVQTVNELSEHAAQYYVQAQTTQREALVASSAQLQLAPEELRDKTAKIATAVQALSEHIPVELDVFNQLEALTSGPRLVNMTLSFNNELDAIFQEKERYRIYLVYYAGALLILLGYLGLRL
ncbi:MAG: hypothetical protein GJU76_13180, partial [Gallionella sp.]|nr:hypothetical protein [Gallionella sp.]